MLKGAIHDGVVGGLSAATRISRFFKDLLFPFRCVSCRTLLDPESPDSADAFFCPDCLRQGIPRFGPPFCPRCGHLFETGENHTCEACLKRLPRIGKVRAALVYDGLVRKALPLFKYGSRLSLGRLFEPMLYECFDRYFPDTDILMPIPLHVRKLRQRGFNQSFLLMRHFVRQYRRTYGVSPPWHVDVRSLERVRYTQPQTGFDIVQRRRNLKNAFALVRPGRVKDRRILLVDDVYTTGTTCTEAARVLLKGGASSVDVLVLARA